jgi:hypothetical protein
MSWFNRPIKSPRLRAVPVAINLDGELKYIVQYQHWTGLWVAPTKFMRQAYLGRQATTLMTLHSCTKIIQSIDQLFENQEQLRKAKPQIYERR